MALTQIKTTGIADNAITDAKVANDITIDTASAVPASGITGDTLASGVTASSLTSVGTLTGLTTSGNVTISKGNAMLNVQEPGGSQAYLFSGGSFSALRTTSNHPIHITSNYSSADKAIFGTDGNLNITATSNNALTLFRSDSGNVMQIGCTTVSDDASIYLRSNGVFNFHTPGAGQIRFSSGGSQALNLDASQSASFSGNVTISKSSPKMTIFASNAGSQEVLTFDRNTASNGDSQEIKWRLQGDSYPGGYIRHTFIEAGNTKLDFGNRENGTVNNMMTIGAGGEIEAIKHSFISCAVSDRRGFLFKGDGGTSRGSASVQNSGYYGMVFGRSSYDHTAGSQAVGKSHWGGISIIGFAGSGVQGIDIVAWGYGNGGATVLKSGNWVGSLSRSYSTSNYHLMVNVGTDVSMWSILIGV